MRKGKEIMRKPSIFEDVIEKAYRRKIRNERLEALSNDKNSIYNEIILNNFVPREFKYYGSKGKEYFSIHNIKSEIEYKGFPKRNVIITGAAGMGKTTALKWLFYNSNVKNTKYIYWNARDFEDCKSLNQFCKELSEELTQKALGHKSSIIFLDGLDELKFIEGSCDEWEEVAQLIERDTKAHPQWRFVISTRPEHFGFHHLFPKKGVKKTPDRYAVFEIQPLTKKEAFASCYLVKKLNAFDREKNREHFVNKWPIDEEENNILTEKQYVKQLKEYIKSMAVEDSLLNSPLICRYGYQIICDWYSQRKIQSAPKTQNERIQRVLESIIKWEFHDHNYSNTESESGKKSLKNYKKEVIGFLVQVARTMGNEGYINKEQWYELRQGLETNTALCVLQEESNGNLEFIHKTFENYFLAYYFSAIKDWGDYDSETYDMFHSLLNTNSEFAIMYVEQLVGGSNDLSEKVCTEIMKYEDFNTEDFLEYAKGKRWLVYLPEFSFSVEEYLSVFPDGGCIYAGNIFNRETVRNIKKNGILEIRDTGYLKAFNKDSMFRTVNITGIQAILPNIHRLGTHFYIATNERLLQIYALKMVYQGSIENRRCQSNDEHIKMHGAMRDIIDFIGKEKEFWCLYHSSYVYVYQIAPENEKNMVDLFKKFRLSQLIDGIIAYGVYKAITGDENEIIRKNCFRKIDSIQFDFPSDFILREECESGLMSYYENLFFVIQWLHSKTKNTLNRKKYAERLAVIKNLTNTAANEKLKLYFYDMYLYALYCFEEGEEMVTVAKNTISLCEKYNHVEGIKFREFLMDDNTCFNGNDLMKVYEFARGYIWM